MSGARESFRLRASRRLARFAVALADMRERWFGTTPSVTRPQRVVFVCRGNVCRSAFAEQALQRMQPGLPVESAGVQVSIRSPAPSTAVEVAREFELDLRPHVSRSITTVRDEPGTLYLAFEPWQTQALLGQRPNVRGRAFTLGSWAQPRRSVIRDPYGGDARRFRVCFRQIDHALEHLVARWGRD